MVDIPVPQVKDSISYVYDLVEAAGWSVPPRGLVQDIVEDAADSNKCISFDIFVRYSIGARTWSCALYVVDYYYYFMPALQILHVIKADSAFMDDS